MVSCTIQKWFFYLIIKYDCNLITITVVSGCVYGRWIDNYMSFIAFLILIFSRFSLQFNK